MKLKLEATPIFEKTWDALKSGQRIIVNEGGTGSSKSYSLAQIFVLLMFQEQNKILTIARKTMPALRSTAMRDFFGILKQHELYSETKHNKSENIYEYGTNLVEFISVDEPMRVRGRRRDFIWLNEANEFFLEDWRQLTMRTYGRIFLDYNPSFQYHWIYDEVIPRKDCVVIPSTYKDNPFLPKEVVDEIEHYKEIDENYWRIYGLGLRGVNQVLVFPVFEYCDELPQGEKVYGLDFGYNHPSALVEACLRDEGWHLDELLHEKYLTNSQLITRLDELKVNRKQPIYCDSAEPQRIEEIKQAGFNALPADKTQGSVKKGIDTMKSRRIFVTKRSLKLANELKKYSWKTGIDGKIDGDKVVELFDDGICAARYGIHTHYSEHLGKGKFKMPPKELGFGGVKPYF